MVKPMQLKVNSTVKFWEPLMRGGSWGIYLPILVVFGGFHLKVAPGWGFLRPPAFRQAAGVGRDSHKIMPLMMGFRSWFSTEMVKAQRSCMGGTLPASAMAQSRLAKQCNKGPLRANGGSLKGPKEHDKCS